MWTSHNFVSLDEPHGHGITVIMVLIQNSFLEGVKKKKKNLETSLYGLVVTKGFFRALGSRKIYTCKCYYVFHPSGKSFMYWLLKRKKKKRSDESYGHLKPSAACRCVSAGVEIYAEILPRAAKAPPW